MVRVVAPGGKIIITETVHDRDDVAQEVKNALLDRWANLRTSLQMGVDIPTPLDFFSVEELRAEIEKLGCKIIFEEALPATASDLKKHVIFCAEVGPKVAA